MTNPFIFTTSPDPVARGLDYLHGLRSVALEPEMIDVVHDLEGRGPICTWIGEQIEAINAHLNDCLRACEDCFHPWARRAVQIAAAPLAKSFGISGLCNLQTQPATLLIDVGQVIPEDWLRVVVHEYAHAHAGVPGHHPEFARSLTHLCLGLGIAPPQPPLITEADLRMYPGCRLTQDPLAFWRGEAPDWRSRVKNYYFLSQTMG